MKRVFLIILLHLSLFFIVFAYQAQGNEVDWEVSEYKNQSYAVVSGEIQYSDKFSFVLSPDEQCEEVSSMFSFFTWNNPRDFDQLIGRRVPIKLNDIETTAEVLSTFSYKEGLKSHIRDLYLFLSQIKPINNKYKEDFINYKTLFESIKMHFKIMVYFFY